MFRCISHTGNPNNPVFTTSHNCLFTAVETLVASRFNEPRLKHILMDADGFIVSGAEIAKVAEQVRAEARRMLDACNTFLWAQETAPAEPVSGPDADGLTTFKLAGEPLSNAPGSEKLPPAPYSEEEQAPVLPVDFPEVKLEGYGTRSSYKGKTRLLRTTATLLICYGVGASGEVSYLRTSGKQRGSADSWSGVKIPYEELDRLNREYPGVRSL
jgi:hypothetical protein